MASSWESREGFMEEQVSELDLGEWKELIGGGILERQN